MKNFILAHMVFSFTMIGGAVSYIASEKAKFINEAYILFIGGITIYIACAVYYLITLNREATK